MTPIETTSASAAIRINRLANSNASHDDPRVIAALEKYFALCENGPPPDRHEFLAQYPEISAQLGPCLEGLALVQAAVPGVSGNLQKAPARAGGSAAHSSRLAPRDEASCATDCSELAVASSARADLPLPLGEGGVRVLGDFRILREIGRGGMGVVYEAEQISLNRRVALKVLPFASMLDPRHLQRFKNEALAAAHLDHPNIVEVHAVGCERGVHFYAMRYVEGQTLAEVIEGMRGEAREASQSSRLAPRDEALDVIPRSHAPRGNEPAAAPRHDRVAGVERSEPPDASADTVAAARSTLADTPLAPRSSILDPSTRDFFRTIAQLGIQAAEALDHAHQMGIVHRDIKPSNLMLEVRNGERGMRNGESNASPSGRGQGEGNSALRTPNSKLFITDFGLAHIESDVTLTMTGDLLGTLRYMSPEQAEGRSAILDHRTDIYSLGVTLYEILTLQPAFPATDRQTLLKQITQDEPPAPRKLNKHIPADLETIVLKSISKDSRDRYASAIALADDLRRWLDQKPILARPPGIWQRTAKWCRRRIAFIVSLMAALSVLAISFILAFVWVTRAYQEKSVESQRATDNLQQTHQVIDRLLTRVAENRLLTAPHMAPLRKSLLLDALEANRALLEMNDESTAARYEVARAHLRASTILSDLGEKARSVDHAQHALALAEALVAESNDAQYQVLLADCYSQLAGTRSRDLMAKAVALLEALVEAHPDSVEYRKKLARGYSNLAVCTMRAGGPGEAVDLLRKSLALAPNIAMTHTNLASILAPLKRYQEAAHELRIAIELGDPTDPHLVPWARYTLGCVLAEMGRADESLVELRTALTEIDSVVRDHPRVTEWRRQQAYNLITLSDLVGQSRCPEAIPFAERAVATVTELLRQTNESPEDKQLLNVAQKKLQTLRECAALTAAEPKPDRSSTDAESKP